MNEHRALWEKLGWATPPARAEEALTHPSYAHERRATDNQRLEFLGDAVLDLCVSELLMTAHPRADEGALSRMRAALVNADTLAEWARSVDLASALRVGRGAMAAGDRLQANVLADAVEALVAATYLDGGLDRARALVTLVVGERIERGVALADRDAKSELQEVVQSTEKRAPTYRLAETIGPDHDRTFEVEVLLDDRVLGRGRGRSKKLAEQDAARVALAKLRAATSGEP